MSVELYSSTRGAGPPVVLLHGLFGAGNNLGALARALQADYEVYSLDLPNHGRSAWLSEPTLATMAAAVGQWLCAQGLRDAHVIGHSLGGKVLMQLALDGKCPFASLTVADIAPVAYAPSHQAVFAALNAVSAAACTSREQAAALMAGHLEERGVIEFLLGSLRRGENGKYDWRMDVRGLEAGYTTLLAQPMAQRAYLGPVLFIRGGLSNYVPDSAWAATQNRFPEAQLETVADAGHWLHVEQPEKFNAKVMEFLHRHSAKSAH